MLKKDAWTEEEELILMNTHHAHGNKWAEIAKVLPGRYLTLTYTANGYRTMLISLIALPSISKEFRFLYFNFPITCNVNRILK